jgi:hypothetical protein
MTTKRTPINRAARRQITPHAADLFRQSCELEPIRDACIRDKVCRSDRANEHCAECAKSIELHLQLFRVLGLKPWHWIDYGGVEEPAGLSAAKREKWWTEALEEALADTLADAQTKGFQNRGPG